MAMSQGLGGLKTRDFEHCSRTLQTNGMATMRRLLSYPWMRSSLNAMFCCLIGLFLASVRPPSHDPRFLRSVRSVLDWTVFSELRSVESLTNVSYRTRLTRSGIASASRNLW